jgi:glutathione S-transferase
MFELIQFPWSPFCLVQKRILEFSGTPHRVTNIPPSDRSLVWRLTRKRYYQVPILKHGKAVIFETSDTSQVVAKYLEAELQLGLFPQTYDGVQKILWRYIENEVEGVTFKLNDAYYFEFVPATERLCYLRFKERKFGRGCLDQWLKGRKHLQAELVDRLIPFEQMLCDKPYLLDARPRFVDFDLWGMLANVLYSGHYRLPSGHSRLRAWYGRMSQVTVRSCEKLHS